MKFTKKTKVLITNGDNLRTLSFFRALQGLGDIEVHVASERWFSACFFSRFCKHKLINANPKKRPSMFIKQLAEYCSKHSIDVLVPMNADELEIILKYREHFSHVKIPFPDYRLFHKLKDKWEFYSLMHKFGVLTPKTVRVRNLPELNRTKLSYPLIVKIRTGAGSKGVAKVDSKEELVDTFERTVKEFGLTPDSYPIIQEYIEGENLCVAAVCKDGRVLSTSAFKSLRQYPIKHGTSTSRVSMIDEKLSHDAEKILKKLKWHGIAQFDAIKKGGKYYFLEMNPRFYTSINLTVKAGLNYPYYVCKLDDITRITDHYKAGVKCRIIMADKLVFLNSIFGKGKYPLREYFNFKGTYFDDFCLSDPLPTIPLMVKLIRGKLL